jgi:hypothetical protein
MGEKQKHRHTPTAQSSASPANDLEARKQAAAERWAPALTLDLKIDKNLELRWGEPENNLKPLNLAIGRPLADSSRSQKNANASGASQLEFLSLQWFRQAKESASDPLKSD